MGQELCQILKLRFFQNFVPKIVRQNQNLGLKIYDFYVEFGIRASKLIFQKSEINFS